jgi:hypothetical protein
LHFNNFCRDLEQRVVSCLQALQKPFGVLKVISQVVFVGSCRERF